MKQIFACIVWIALLLTIAGALLWFISSVGSSTFKAGAGHCEKTFPIEEILPFATDWFCP